MRLFNSFLTTTAVAFSMTTAAFAASSDTSAEVGASVSAGDNSADVNANANVKSGADSKQASNNSDGDASVRTDGDASGDEILVVTVDGEEITQADVSNMIALLPKQVQQQPQERLVPMVVDQLIMRELILDAAAQADLKGSQQVKTEMDKANVSEEEAVVNVYLREKLDESVTDKEVKATYEEIKSNTDKELPPFEAVKAQIEKQLRYEAYASLREDLQSDVEIVFYGPDGKPQTASDS